MTWVTADAPTREELSACVQCGLCLPACPTFRLTGMETASPRGRLSAMSAVAAGVIDLDATFDETMSFCLQCRACEAVCPSLVPFGRAMEGARAELSAQRPQGRRIRQIVLGRGLASRGVVGVATAGAAMIQRTGWWWLVPRRMRGGLAGLRKVPVRPPTHVGMVRPPKGPQRGTAALLSGCVMDPWFGAVHDATIDLLAAAGYAVTVPEGQTCCGALAAHDGAAEAAHRLAEQNVNAFKGFDVVVVNSAGCGAHLKQYGHWASTAGAELGDRVRDVTEVVADSIDAGLLPDLDTGRGSVAVQDPCHLRHAQRITSQPRRVLQAAGYDLIELSDDGLCCGAAGVYSVLRPDTSAELGRRKTAQILATGSTVVATANPGCEIQLRSHLPRWAEIRHPVELYHRALLESVEDGGPKPGSGGR